MTERDGGRIAQNPDPLTPDQRRLNMSRIRARDTKPELLLRKGLYAAGLKYRLHVARLPGRPDIVISGRHTAIFVHGCFWHGHNCPKGVTPGVRTAFWIDKFARNRARDDMTARALDVAGWRVLVVWECALRGRARRNTADIVEEIRVWLAGNMQYHEIAGDW